MSSSANTSGLWIDQNQPKSFKDLSYHPSISNCLKRMASSGDFPHFLFFGPSGAGKRTRAMCFLREVYGAGVDRTRLSHETFETSNNKKVEINLIASNYHLEINPSDAGIYDRFVIQDLIKTTAQSNQLDATNQKSFKVILISEADNLTKDAQHALRRTMEKYVSSCRLILIANSVGKVIPALRSRCQMIRIPAPTVEEAAKVVHQVSRKERFSITMETATRIAESANRNLRVALLKCEVMKLKQTPNPQESEFPEAPWESYVRETAAIILSKQSKEAVLQIRKRLYCLLEKCIPSQVIFVELAKCMIERVDFGFKPVLARLAAHYETSCNIGDKAIFHLEAFVAKFMHLYLVYQSEGFCDKLMIE
ncbi:replication factor C subunit 3-like [Symsagittifera roscoffensis]|uniref:replication factor C subunit 3-like n=1 Tax=Symsagittifera roscoffensis TaxID=84072 RepID=UPI00307C3764